VVFIKFKNEILRLRPQEDSERLNDRHHRKDNFICHSAAGEESYIFSFQVKKSKKRSFGLRPQDDKERQIYKNLGTLSAK